MKKTVLFAALILTASATLAAADVVAKAESAIREGFPQAAIAPLEEALRQAPAAGRGDLALLLARAQLAAGRPADALRTLDNSAARGSVPATVLRAEALAAQGSLEPAARLAQAHAAGNREAALLLARIRFEQGDHAAALAALPQEDAGLPSDRNALRLLLDLQLAGGDAGAAEKTIEESRAGSLLPAAELDTALARLRLAGGRASEAAEIFQNVLAATDLPAPVRDNARLGLARSLVALGVDKRARDVLRESLVGAPDALNTRQVMQLWIELENKLGGDPSADLRSWSAEASRRRTLEAGLQIARLDLEGRNLEAAGGVLEKLATDPNLSPEDGLRVRLLLAETRVVTGRVTEAVAILDEIDTTEAGPPYAYRLAELRGRALAAAGSHRRAFEAFGRARQAAADPAEARAAATNQFLCSLALGDLKLARASLEEIRQAAPESPELLRWSFLLAAAEAREGRADSLGALARSAPSADYSFQAKLALAEWRLARGEAAAAERILRTAGEEAVTPPRAAALAAAEIFAADNAGSRTREELAGDCEAFLVNHPDAPEQTDILFKLGELHTRGGDHAAAEAVYVRLVQDQAEPEAAALAKFLAAQSAARSMNTEGAARALLWFDEIAQGGTTLRHRARFEQAGLLVRDQRFDDALRVYDGILAGDPPPEVRHAALMEKGDTLAALGAEKTARLGEAAKLYAELAAEASAPADWRDQASCKRAAVLARAGQAEAALAAYRDVLARPPGEKADHFWFYKAGLEAGRLLEEQQDWPAAIAVYDLMASAGGPQSEEIKQRSRRLRLEHFIWEN